MYRLKDILRGGILGLIVLHGSIAAQQTPTRDPFIPMHGASDVRLTGIARSAAGSRVALITHAQGTSVLREGQHADWGSVQEIGEHSAKIIYHGVARVLYLA